MRRRAALAALAALGLAGAAGANGPATYTVVPAGEPEWTVFGHTLLYAGQKFMVSIGSVGSNTLADMAGVKVTIDFDTAPATLNRQNSDAYTP